jgi:hypothetical protein
VFLSCIEWEALVHKAERAVGGETEEEDKEVDKEVDEEVDEGEEDGEDEEVDKEAEADEEQGSAEAGCAKVNQTVRLSGI